MFCNYGGNKWPSSLQQNYEPSKFPEVLNFDNLRVGRRTRSNDKIKPIKIYI